jgi:lysophospholipase L1-like esterase
LALQEKEFFLYDWLQRQVKSMGIPFIALLDDLRLLGRAAWLPHDMGHLSPAGQQRVAQRLHEALEELKLVQ